MRLTTRERIANDPHRSLTHTAPDDLPGAVLLDQTGVRPVAIGAITALDTPDTVFAVPSPYRPGVLILGAANSDTEREPLPPTFVIEGREYTYRGPCVIVAYESATGETVPLTLDELLRVLRHVYILTANGAPESHVVWLIGTGGMTG